MIPDLQLIALPDFPIVSEPISLEKTIDDSLKKSSIVLENRDILVIAQTVVSKAEGRIVRLTDVTPSAQAIELAALCRKDPRLVEVILRESNEVIRSERSHLITRHRLGYVSANACVDRSNVMPSRDWVCLLPEDPVASALRIMRYLRQSNGVDIGVIISDSHGRPFRLGAVGVALAAVGFLPIRDYRGTHDLFGHELLTSTQAIADEIASAASLLMGQGKEGQPVILVRGYEACIIDGVAEDSTLVRPKEQDLFR